MPPTPTANPRLSSGPPQASEPFSVDDGFRPVAAGTRPPKQLLDPPWAVQKPPLLSCRAPITWKEPQAWSTRRLATMSGHFMLAESVDAFVPTRNGSVKSVRVVGPAPKVPLPLSAGAPPRPSEVLTMELRRGSSNDSVPENPFPNWNV